MQLITDGLQFPEGPVVMADGSIVLVEIRRGTLDASVAGWPARKSSRSWVADRTARPSGRMARCTCVTTAGAWEWEPGEASLPAGPVPEYRGGSIQRVDLRTGKFTTLYDSCEGKPLNSPNDIVFDSTGGFWFTTLGYFDGENRRLGAVYYARAGWIEDHSLAQWGEWCRVAERCGALAG